MINHHSKLTPAAYARHRVCSRAAVSKAIAQGRISVDVDGMIDPVGADAQWRAHTRPRMPNIGGTIRRDPTPADPFELARALGEVADQRLQAGQPLGDLVPALRVALRDLPVELRDPVPFSLAVIEELVRPIRDAMWAALTPAERVESASACAAMTDPEAAGVGAFWYQVAAGEVTVP